ncbi:MAG: UbiA family prenyltransferase [Verrucomicrobiales bacterium]|nr:UbiA family prenyltransferase [Verrucomicrobiales bacterium]
MRTLLILGRISNLPTIWTNVLVGWFLCGGPWGAELAWIALGVSGLYLGGMTLNDAFDADWDREHAPERPIPAGKISRKAVWAIGVVEMLGGILILLAQTSFHPLLLLCLVQAILLYNFLHKRWEGSVLIMGICRALVYIGAGSAVVMPSLSVEVSPVVLFIAFAVVIYIAGLTLAARSEHLKSPAGLTFRNRLMLMLPVLFPLIASRLMPVGAAQIALVVVGVVGIWAWITVMRKALHEKIPKGIAFAIAGIAFFDAATVAFADWQAAVICLAFFALTLVAQRFIPAT